MSTDRASVEACRRRRRRRLALTLAGFAIAAPAMFGELSSLVEARLTIAGAALMVASAAIGAVQDRDRVELVFALAFPAIVAFTVSEKIRETPDFQGDLVTAGLIVVFFVAPIPLALAYFGGRRDELQRSIATNAAGIAFLATLFGSIGYAVLDALGGLDPLPPIAIPLFAVGTWLIAWASLRWKVA